ncbi:TPA: cell division protein FtsK [Candidatus Falkowbacteria bacterium]|nr:MAG: Cell division FtsK/SpoIIIE [Candidatus Falkowbacteria bacterium GW2011_GWF2_43_32]HBA36789.1 cell division protein FtsK [Candidatus Falkowbacteria bacterium]
MSRKKKNTNPFDYVTLPEFNLNDRAKRSIFIVIISVLGVISLLGLFNLSGHFGQFLSRELAFVFGFGKWLAPLLFLYWALILIRKTRKSLNFTDYLGLFLLFVSYQTLFHFFIKPINWEAMVRLGQGGGYVGWQLSRLFFYLFGFWGGVLVLVALLLISLVLVFNASLDKIVGRESLLAKIARPFVLFFKSLFSSEDNFGEERDFGAEAREEILGAWEKREVPAKMEKLDTEDEADEADEVLPVKKSPPSGLPKKQEKIVWPQRSIKIDLPLELLNNKFSKAIGGDTEINAHKIQKTLEKFGIVVEMGETKVGPTVTQYTFRPAEGVKLSRVTTLSNDLSLALAAHPIRIEAPIPGKSLVGVEVPNRAKAIVGLREILEDGAFKARKNNLLVALGKDVAGTAWLYDLTKMPHLLVAGATNSGKSVCLNAIIISLLYQNNPDDLRFIMVDPKRVELPTYNGIPHLLTPVITDVNKTINALKWCLNEMERRYDVLNKAGKRNIQSYNAASAEKLPYIVFIIDELADFMMTSGKEMEAAIIRLAQMSRAIGIHLILATQRPSVDVITGLIKANVPTRIAFSVASLVDSKTILDSSGAEKLLGQGDMLFTAAELSKPKRIQGAYLSDNEINDVVNYIKDKSGPAEYLEGITDRQKVSGNAGVGLDGTHGDEDELFEEAQALIVRAGKASTSMLQRRLSIGYGRAAKILDMLEEAGVIGPSNGAKPREVMISAEQYEAMAGGGISSLPVHNRQAAAAPDSYLEEEEVAEEEEDDAPLVFKNGNAAATLAAVEADNEDDGEETDNIEEENIEEEDEEEENAEEENVEAENSDEEEEIVEEEAAEEEAPSTPTEKAEPTVKRTPLDDDDEMFFAK